MPSNGKTTNPTAASATSAAAKTQSSTAAKKAVSKQRAADVAARAAVARAAVAAPAPAVAQSLSATAKKTVEKDMRAAVAATSVSRKTAAAQKSPFEHLHTQSVPVLSRSGQLMRYDSEQRKHVSVPFSQAMPAFHTEQTDVGMRATGAEYISPVGKTGSAHLAGDIIAQFLFNPLAVGARLPIVGSLYERWKSFRLRLVYKPTLSMANPNANGQIVMALVLDPEDPLPDGGITSVQRAVSYAPNAQLDSIWTDFSFEAALLPNAQNELYVSNSGDPRLLYQFKAFMMAATDLADIDVGSWMLLYDIAFNEPVVSSDVVTKSISGFSELALNDAAGGAANNRPLPFKEVATVNGFLTVASYFGAGPAAEADGQIGLIGDTNYFQTADDGTLIVPPGNYRVDYVQTSGTDSASSTAGLNAAYPTIGTGAGTPAPTVTIIDSIQNVNNGSPSLDYAQFFNAEDKTAAYAARSPPGLFFRMLYRSWNMTVAETANIFIWAPTFQSTGGGGNGLCQGYISITKTGDGDGAKIGAQVSALANPRVANLELEHQQHELQLRRAVERAITANPDPSAEYRAVVNALLTKRRADALAPVPPRASTTPLIAPAIAATVAWFVATYGPTLGKAALDWGVKKLEQKLK